MKYYELTYLISPELSTEELSSLSQKVSGFIAERQGNIKKSSEPARKRLAYSIKNKSDAFLSSLDFYLSPEKLNDLEKKLKEEDKIIRYLIINKKEAREIPVKRRIKPAPETAPARAEEEETKSSKVELKEIDKKIEEILQE